MKTSFRLFLASALLIAGGAPVVSQGPETASESPPRPDPPKEGEPMNREQLEYSIWFVDQHIETRNKRAKEVVDDLKRMDTRIEERIDWILQTLSEHKDSVDSGSKIIRLKMDAVDGLMKTIEFYDIKRTVLKKEFMRPNPKIDRDLILEDLEKFNQRVEKRVEQILALVETMPGYKDIDKYESKSRGGYWGGHFVTRNPDYYHNKSQTSKAVRTQENVAEELEEDIRNLKVTEAQLVRTLDAEITQQFRDLLKGELERTRDLIRTREYQKIAVLTADSNAPGKAMGSEQASNLEDLFQDMSNDLRRDFYEMFRLYSDLNRERQQLLILHEQRDSYLAQLEALE